MALQEFADARHQGFCFQAEDGIRVLTLTGVQTCALPIWLSELGDGLRAAVPVTQRSTILHGDYRLDNAMMRIHGDGAAVAAVFDWEMSTLGDPLADLGLDRKSVV